MATIKEYLKYYKDLSFNECNFNINDVILFTELAYMKWDGIVSNNKNRITLKEAGELYLSKNQSRLNSFLKANNDNLKEMISSKRYKNIYLSNYSCINDNTKQFGALCIYFEPGSVFVSFEGTDGSIVGWKEDFEFGYKYPAPSQSCAIKYLNSVITRRDRVIYIGGHSKGGNLAMTAGKNANNNIFKRISTIFNLDGPGFREKEYNTKEFERVLPKIKRYVPEDSIIGLLLYSGDNYNVVKSNGKGIFAHDCNTWQCFGSFLEEGELSKKSIKFDKKVKSWNKKYTDKELEKIFTTFFNVLEDNNIKNFSEFKKLKWSQITNIISKIKNIDEDTKKIYLEALKELLWNKSDDKIVSIKIKKEGK